MADTTRSEFDVLMECTPTQSTLSPLKTSISSQSASLFSPQTDQNSQSHVVFRQPGPASSNSYATSEVWSEQDGDGSHSAPFSGNGYLFGAQTYYGHDHEKNPASRLEPPQSLNRDSDLTSSMGSWVQVDDAAVGGYSNYNSMVTGLVQNSASSTRLQTSTGYDVVSDSLFNTIGMPSSSGDFGGGSGREGRQPSYSGSSRSRGRSQHLGVPPQGRRRSDPPLPQSRSRSRGAPLVRSRSQNTQQSSNRPPLSTAPISGTNNGAAGSGRGYALQQTLTQRPPRGKRKRQLTEREREHSRQKRDDRSTCILCKMSKVRASTCSKIILDTPLSLSTSYS